MCTGHRGILTVGANLCVPLSFGSTPSNLPCAPAMLLLCSLCDPETQNHCPKPLLYLSHPEDLSILSPLGYFLDYIFS